MEKRAGHANWSGVPGYEKVVVMFRGKECVEVARQFKGLHRLEEEVGGFNRPTG